MVDECSVENCNTPITLACGGYTVPLDGLGVRQRHANGVRRDTTQIVDVVHAPVMTASERRCSESSGVKVDRVNVSTQRPTREGGRPISAQGLSIQDLVNHSYTPPPEGSWWWIPKLGLGIRRRGDFPPVR